MPLLLQRGDGLEDFVDFVLFLAGVLILLLELLVEVAEFFDVGVGGELEFLLLSIAEMADAIDGFDAHVELGVDLLKRLGRIADAVEDPLVEVFGGEDEDLLAGLLGGGGIVVVVIVGGVGGAGEGREGDDGDRECRQYRWSHEIS